MRPNRVVVAFGTPVIFIMDYFQSTMSVEVVVLSGGPATVEYTNDDVNDLTVTPTWFAAAAPLASVAATAIGPVTPSLTPVRALRLTCTVAGSAAFTILQTSGPDGI